MRAIVPVSLRKPEQRHTARAMADAILNADRRRQRPPSHQQRAWW